MFLKLTVKVVAFFLGHPVYAIVFQEFGNSHITSEVCFEFIEHQLPHFIIVDFESEGLYFWNGYIPEGL